MKLVMLPQGKYWHVVREPARGHVETLCNRMATNCKLQEREDVKPSLGQVCICCANRSHTRRR